MTKLFSRTLLLLFLTIATSAPSANADDHEPIVPGYQRFEETEKISERQKGLLLLNELNCMSCHQAESSWPIKPKQAPILTQVGTRVYPEYFEKFIADPHGTKPGTTMPDVLVGKSAAEKTEIAKSIGQFLASTGKALKENASGDLVNKGNQLFHSVGCVACHDPQNEDTHIGTSIPLGKLEDKYAMSGLTRFIQDPLHVRPSGRMPQFNLSGAEAQAIAAYLLRDVVVNSKINFAYYEGRWESLPDFDQLKPVSTGVTSGFEMNVGRKKDGFGVVYTGYWETSKPGKKFKFRLGSDDGSRLIIDGKTIVTNDGIHGVQFKENEVRIKPGIHEVRVEFFEAAGGEDLIIEVSGGGLDRAEFESLLRPTKEEISSPDQADYKYDVELAAKGKEHFQSLGCANCHEMKSDGNLIAATQNSKPLSQLNVQGGCLTGNSGASFGLTDHQIKCITDAIAYLKNPTPAPVVPQTVVHEKFVTLNCYACHNREGKDQIFGGVVDVSGDSLEIYGRKKWFTGTQAEMGDEGQHPPSLKSAGAKLNPAWLDKVLNEGIKSRPYMNTRMPKFGGKKVFGELANDLIRVDKLPKSPAITQTETVREIKAHGRYLAGEDALSCIKCHTFGKYNATGIQAIDLTTMTQRLNKDWFQAYMLKPSRFRRGTRMPESWPQGKSFYPDMLDGDSQKQIDAVWTFLSDGTKAAKPKGLVRSVLELKAINTPKIYRNFIQGAGPRAIGVGYPEQSNLAFDAQDCRMALVWQENFIDASRHWTGRGQGFEAPLGEKVWQLPDSVVFATELNDGQWPTEFSDEQKPKFKGYRFDKDRRPIFKYEIGDVTIEDQPIPYVVDGRSLLKRKLKFTSRGSKSIHFLIAAGDSMENQDEMVVVDKTYKTKVAGAAGLKLMKRGSKPVAVVTINLSSGSAEVEQTYDW